MADITDQDRRKALAWAGGSQAIGIADAAARVILATVDAPEPTLADEIRGLPDFTMSGDNCINDCHERADDVAFRVEQMEHDLAEARAEVDRLTAERQEETMRRVNEQYDDLPVRDRDWLDKDGLPDPADVPPGEAWEVIATDPAKSFGGTTSYNTVAFRMTDRWIVCRQGYQMPLVVPDDCIRLVRRHVPAPRVITNPDEAWNLPISTIIRDSRGETFERTEDGWGRISIPVKAIKWPVTVLWEPEAGHR
jgi:hypothetical protein